MSSRQSLVPRLHRQILYYPSWLPDQVGCQIANFILAFTQKAIQNRYGSSNQSFLGGEPFPWAFRMTGLVVGFPHNHKLQTGADSPASQIFCSWEDRFSGNQEFGFLLAPNTRQVNIETWWTSPVLSPPQSQQGLIVTTGVYWG